MQKALICELPMRLTSQRHCLARSFHGMVCGISRLAMACRRCSCGWSLGASARLALACCSICWYCWAAEFSSVSAGTSLRRRDAEPTSTGASTGAAALAPAASRKARRADHGDEGATEGAGQKRHIQGDPRRNNERRWHTTHQSLPRRWRPTGWLQGCVGDDRQNLHAPMSDTSTSSAPNLTPEKPHRTPWLQTLRVYLEPASLRMPGWLLLAQALIVAGLVGMALADPRQTRGPIVWCALAVAFGSATQDIALDAFRIESADANHQAALAASYQTGSRLAMIWAGAGVLWIAARSEVAPAVGQAIAQGAAAYQNSAWQVAYLVMAASMAVGVVTVLFSREPAPVQLPPARNAAEWIQSAMVEPFADFLRRYGWHAALILALIAVYRISDV